jgi:ribonuclease T2
MQQPAKADLEHPIKMSFKILQMLAAALALAVTLVGPAEAQRANGFERAPGGQQRPGGREHVAGKFDYYALVLSWSPSYCAGLTKGEYEPQCHRRDGKRYSFILHGLWPQYERGFPGDCPTPQRAFVPENLIERMQDIMPSRRLVIHEYRKHGTCSGLAPDAYYDLARKLFAKINIPPRFNNPGAPFTVSPEDTIRDFVAATPGLKPDSIGVVCGGPGNRLRELRICFNRDGEFRACGSNENQRRLCGSDRMFVPPAR